MLSIADDPIAEGIEKSVKSVLDWLTRSQGKCLLVLDNADKIQPGYIPTVAYIHMLITSRNSSLVNELTDSMNVQPMPNHEALKLFLSASKLEIDSDDSVQTHLAEIVESLGCLPLAVDIAGETIQIG